MAKKESTRREVTLERGWILILNDLEIDPENVLRRAQLPMDLLSRESVRLSSEEYFRLWRGIEDEAEDPTLPLRLGQAISLEAFHPAIFAAMCSPNLVIAVKRISEYKRLIAPMSMMIESRLDGFFVSLQWDGPDPRLPISLAATELIFLVQMARIATRERILPLRVESPYLLEPKDDYQDFFGTTPEMSNIPGVTFSTADAQRPFLTARESLWEAFEPELRRRLRAAEKINHPESPRYRIKSFLLLAGRSC